MNRIAAFVLVLVLLVWNSYNYAEEVIWRIKPAIGFSTIVPDRVITSFLGPGPINADYALAQVLVECFPGQPRVGFPGCVNRVTTFFEDDAQTDFQFIPGAVLNVDTGHYEIPGMARLNVFVVSGPLVLPLAIEDPDFGQDVNAVFSQNLTDGWIEVRAINLSSLNILIQDNVRYFVGLTPLFPTGALPFGGTHITNVSGIGNESQSAVRQTAPAFDDWFFAGNQFGPPPEMFAAIEINGSPAIKLGDANMDGFVNLLDVDPFIAILGDGLFAKEADINGDGFVNLLDVAGFVEILSAG